MKADCAEAATVKAQAKSAAMTKIVVRTSGPPWGQETFVEGKIEVKKARRQFFRGSIRHKSSPTQPDFPNGIR